MQAPFSKIISPIGAELMTKDDPITPEYLRQLLAYDHLTGRLTWKPRPIESFQSPQGFGWNTKHAGRAAGGRHLRSGFVVAVNKHQFLAHRVAWAIMTGAWPKQSIDHINRNPYDNRWANLREATPVQQCMNRGRTSPLPKGVRRHGREFLAVIGSYKTAEEAHAAWLIAAKVVHGEFFSAY
jgi:hypothetical protein